MPSRAKYLSFADEEKIISLRGTMRPLDIATMYGIGLTRLYKIWIDSTPDKRFPGGLSGARTGKKLVEETTSLQTRIQQRREKLSSLKTIDEKLTNYLKTITDKIQTQQNSIKLLNDKYTTTAKNVEIMKQQYNKLIEEKKLTTEIEKLNQ